VAACRYSYSEEDAKQLRKGDEQNRIAATSDAGLFISAPSLQLRSLNCSRGH